MYSERVTDLVLCSTATHLYDCLEDILRKMFLIGWPRLGAESSESGTEHVYARGVESGLNRLGSLCLPGVTDIGFHLFWSN